MNNWRTGKERAVCLPLGYGLVYSSSVFRSLSAARSSLFSDLLPTVILRQSSHSGTPAMLFTDMPFSLRWSYTFWRRSSGQGRSSSLSDKPSCTKAAV